MHFLRPEWFIALIPLIILWVMFFIKNKQQQSWQEYCDPTLLEKLWVGKKLSRRVWPYICLALAWLAVVFALAGPTWHKLPSPNYKEQTARVILLDMNTSMDARDIKPSRLTQAKYKIRDLLNASADSETALVAYAGMAHIVSPLTNDGQTIAAMLPELNTGIMPVEGHNLLAALKEAKQLLTQAQALNSASIIVITDNQASAKAIDYAKELYQKYGIKTSTLGVGTQIGAPIPAENGGFLKNKKGAIDIARFDPASLQTLSHAGDGVYQKLTSTNSDIQRLLAVKANHLQHMKKLKSDSKRYRDEGHWFVLLPLFCLLLLFRRGWLEAC